MKAKAEQISAAHNVMLIGSGWEKGKGRCRAVARTACLDDIKE